MGALLTAGWLSGEPGSSHIWAEAGHILGKQIPVPS